MGMGYGKGCGCKGGKCDCPDCKRMRGERDPDGDGDFHPIRNRKGGKAVVIARSTGKPLEGHPIPRARALAQLRAIEMKKHGRGY